VGDPTQVAEGNLYGTIDDNERIGRLTRNAVDAVEEYRDVQYVYTWEIRQWKSKLPS